MLPEGRGQRVRANRVIPALSDDVWPQLGRKTTIQSNTTHRSERAAGSQSRVASRQIQWEAAAFASGSHATVPKQNDLMSSSSPAGLHTRPQS